jgi:hypothetical protein
MLTASCGSSAEKKKNASTATAATATATSSASSASNSASAKPAADSLKVDKVKSSDGAIETDGSNDGAISLSVDGPVRTLAVMTVDESGKATDNQQWDTAVGDKPLPKAFEAPFETGESTWQLGVFEGGALKNAADGTVSLPPGHHDLVLYMSDSGYFTHEHHFRVLVERPDGTVVKSNIFTF